MIQKAFPCVKKYSSRPKATDSAPRVCYNGNHERKFSQNAERGCKMEQDVSFEKRGQTLRAKIACELDHHAAGQVREQIDRRAFAERARVLELDFSGVPFMDSSGIGLIIGRAEVGRERGFCVRLCGLSAELSRLVRLSGVTGLPNVTLEEGV